MTAFTFENGGNYKFGGDGHYGKVVPLPDDMTTGDEFYIYNVGGELDLTGGTGISINGTSGDHFVSRKPEQIKCEAVSGGFTITQQGPKTVEYVKSSDGSLVAAQNAASLQRYNTDEVVLIVGCSAATNNGHYIREFSGTTTTKVWTKVSF